MIDELVYFIDNSAPAIVRRLSTQGGATFNVEAGMQFRLKVRPTKGSTIILDQAMTADVDEDTITYQPTPSDFTEQGVYKAWIAVNLGGSNEQDTDEFTINVFDHAPGQGASVGAIYQAAYAMVPIVWRTVKGLADFGDPELQRIIDLAKLRVLHTNIPAVAEASLDPRVIDYIAKKVLVDSIMETAIDFWRDQVVTRTARGNSEEVETYPDRIRATENQLKRFRVDLDNQLSELESVLGATPGTLELAPALDIVAPLVTPGLESFAPAHATWPCHPWDLC